MILDYILRRLALLMFMMLTLSIFTFSLSYLFPGDALTNLSGITNSTFSQTSVLEEKFHFTENYAVQYFAFLERIVQGDWGYRSPLVKVYFSILLTYFLPHSS